MSTDAPPRLRAALSLACFLAASLGCATAAPPQAQPAWASPSPTAAPPAAPAQQPSPADATLDPWPRTLAVDDGTFVVYQPQLESWDGYRITAHAAVSVQPAGASQPAFGVLNLAAETIVDGATRTVTFRNIQVLKSTFPAAPASAAAYGATFQTQLSSGTSTMSLDRIQAAMAATGAETKARQVPVQNGVPRFVFSQVPGALVLVDGEPIWQPVPGTSLYRVVNTRALVLKDGNGVVYVHVLDGFVQAPSLAGPWTLAAKDAPQGGAKVAKDLARRNVVDLMEGQPDPTTHRRPSLGAGVPGMFIATQPTELVVTDGMPDWVPLDGTNLLYVKNCSGNVFKSLADQQTYVLVTGRWFRAPGFDGPWAYVPGNALPADFARIPDDSPKENVKASVPGTPQAAEAAIAAGIPQTAEVDRTRATFTAVTGGPAQLLPIPGTSLQYVANSASPILMVTPQQWYAMENAVWFEAPSLDGPWAVATALPAEIYAIPPSSPLYYVTFVRIYAVSPQYVVVGYTPGYTGALVTPDGVVVYGTGYAYPAYVVGGVWYPAPVTYGYAVGMAWTPWTGWAMGFGFGWAMGFGMGMAAGAFWGPHPYWGGAAWGYHGGAVWGPGGWAATSGNVYHQWGATSAVTRTSGGYNAWSGNAWSSQVAHSYNSSTGRMSAGQRGTVENVYTGNYAHGARGATYDPRTGTGAAGERVTVGNASTGRSETFGAGVVKGPGGQTTGVAQAGHDYYADRNGGVYRYDSQTGSFQQHDAGGGWSNVTSERSGQLTSQAQARTAGDQRSAGSSWGSDHAGADWGGNRSGGWDSGRSSGESRWGGGSFRGGGGFRGGGFRR